jgi:hypothetical protein
MGKKESTDRPLRRQSSDERDDGDARTAENGTLAATIKARWICEQAHQQLKACRPSVTGSARTCSLNKSAKVVLGGLYWSRCLRARQSKSPLTPFPSQPITSEHFSIFSTDDPIRKRPRFNTMKAHQAFTNVSDANQRKENSNETQR